MPRRWIAPLVVCCTLALPASASAHGRTATVALDYRIELGPTPAAVHVSVLDGDRDLRVRVARGTLVLRGDLNEPMLRIGPDGAWANRASITAVGEKLTSAGQGWRRLSSHPEYVWHEHRLSPPPYDGARLGRVARFAIPAELDGRPVQIGGTFVRVARPAWWPWAAGALAAIAALALAIRSRPRLRSTAAVVLGLAAGLSALTAYVSFSAADAPTGGVAWGRVAVVLAFGAALAAGVWHVRGVRRCHLAGVIGAAAAALDLGALGIFLHGAVISALPADAARALCALAVVAGLTALVASLARDDRLAPLPKGVR